MLSLEQIGLIATDTAHSLNLPTEVVGVTPVGHDGGYAEVLLSVMECSAEPCRMVVGVERTATAEVVRQMVTDALREHAGMHPKS
jgi:hypothetical protein